jgi:hypothetical protein
LRYSKRFRKFRINLETSFWLAVKANTVEQFGKSRVVSHLIEVEGTRDQYRPNQFDRYCHLSLQRDRSFFPSLDGGRGVKPVVAAPFPPDEPAQIAGMVLMGAKVNKCGHKRRGPEEIFRPARYSNDPSENEL